MSSLGKQLKWLIAIRLVVVTSVFVPNFLLGLTGDEGADRLDSLYLLAAVTYSASLSYIGLLRLLHRHLELQAYIQFVGDLLLVTGLIYQIGGIESPFSVLYLIVIGAASTQLGRRAGLTVSVMAWVLYTSLLVALYVGWIPNPDPTRTVTLDVLFNRLAVHLFGFSAVALLTSYLAQNVKQKTEDLAELEVFHRDIIESISSGIITTDLEDRITSVNRAGREILQAEEEDLLGVPVYRPAFLSYEQWTKLTAASDERGKIRDEVNFERDGEQVVVGFSISSLNDVEGNERGHILIFQDLSPWRKLQEELRIKDRMAGVGELAAGLAHEIGNPLAAISGSVQMLSGSIAQTSSQGRLLEIILQQSRRLDRIIKGFLKFARPKDRAIVEFDVARLLEENSSLLRNSEEVSDLHQIESALDPPTAKLLGDPDQVSQIFWNLARNALRAMPNGGLLRVVGKLNGESYRIQFTDTGEGMSEKERAKLFHPFKSFFDEGTGIGMAIVYRIVQEHGGRISVESEQGVGTTVTVELPTMGTEALAIPVGA